MCLKHQPLLSIQAVKETPRIIPHCHPIPLEGCKVDWAWEGTSLRCTVHVSAHYKTGIEMEAMTGVSAGLLCVLDMIKSMKKTSRANIQTHPSPMYTSLRSGKDDRCKQTGAFASIHRARLKQGRPAGLTAGARLAVCKMSEQTTFESLDLEAHLLDRLDALNYEFATPVQAMAIPPAIEGKDVLATARTGTGKTAAFVLPILQTHRPGVIICPTRELALQVVNEIERLSGLDNIATALIGGASMKKQIQQLNEWPDAILVATPGRICDHMERGNVDLNQYDVLVLDEADEMLSMGFADDLEYIVEQMNPDHQTLLFSATMPKHVQKLANRILEEPVQIQASGKEERPPSLVKQFVMVCTLRQRVDAIEKL